ncbi:hypothetical protein C8J44_1300 [Sphingomonas sp. PP-CE-3A-406]|uniref:DcrB-related protein n=1 Tax=unclassified Sphingomonas TaxID=196159 RepID=UPI000EFA0ADC|nr:MULTISPECIES: DcrB-related protein [unclassified Sphingomonas]RMB56029.1 hypothetical protein C8J44_1300 [Sphingomonas sp. PP-CE-3A-406]TCP66549.1 hypothetical protein C8J43_1043 [Sphingomonas sp. PP-CE-1G-424]
MQLMSSYRTSVAVFDVPDSWHDQSIVAFRLPPAPGGGGDASFVITKDPGKGVTPFASYFNGQADTIRRSLPGYHELKRELFHANERDAGWLEFQFEKDGRAMQLRQIFFDSGFLAVICTLTTLPADIGYHDADWRRVMASLVFDPPAASASYP